MRLKAIVKQSEKVSRPFRVTKGEKFRLDDIDPEDTSESARRERPEPSASSPRAPRP